MWDQEKLLKAKKMYLECRLDEAFPLFVDLAQEYCGDALYFLGEYYGNGYGHIRKDEKISKKFRKSGEKAGSVLAELNTAYSYTFRGNKMQSICKNVFPTVLKLSESGDAFAQNELADLYLYGLGVEADFGQAIYWLEKAAKQGYWRALFKLGELYAAGQEVKQDLIKARFYYEKAAEKGCKEAETVLGFMYFNGDGVDPDVFKAAGYFRKGFEHGDLESLFMLGRLAMEDTEAGEKNPKEAFSLFQKGVEEKHIPSLWGLGKCYEEGIGVKADPIRAYKYYEEGADAGLPPAVASLGDCYREGKGTTSDINQAVMLYKKAFEMGVMHLADKVGMMYLSGDEIFPNAQRAFVWFEKGAEKEEPNALFHLGICWYEGWGTERDEDKSMECMYRAYAAGYPDAIEYMKEKWNIRIH